MKFNYCVVGIAVGECQGCLRCEKWVHSDCLPLYAQIYKGVFVRATIWDKGRALTHSKNLWKSMKLVYSELIILTHQSSKRPAQTK